MVKVGDATGRASRWAAKNAVGARIHEHGELGGSGH